MDKKKYLFQLSLVWYKESNYIAEQCSIQLMKKLFIMCLKIKQNVKKTDVMKISYFQLITISEIMGYNK